MRGRDDVGVLAAAAAVLANLACDNSKTSRRAGQLGLVEHLVHSLGSHGRDLAVAANVLGCLQNMLLACPATARLFHQHQGAQAVKDALALHASHARASDLLQTGKLVLELGDRRPRGSFFCIPVG
jgi:hypothetical protein